MEVGKTIQKMLKELETLRDISKEKGNFQDWKLAERCIKDLEIELNQ